MSTIRESIEVDVPVRTAYNQWTQFEEFPNFMEGVQEVRQVSDTSTHWKTRIAGAEREFDAEIVYQEPDERVSWRTMGRPKQQGTVTFLPVDQTHTEVTLVIDFEPEGPTEKIGDAMGLVNRRVKGDLRRFKDFIESRGTETGAWRGQV